MSAQYLLNVNVSVDCEWSPYGNWTDCSTTCGPGVKTARRTIMQIAYNGGILCTGAAIKTENCELKSCPGI